MKEDVEQKIRVEFIERRSQSNQEERVEDVCFYDRENRQVVVKREGFDQIISWREDADPI
jgi:hypothetical protein